MPADTSARGPIGASRSASVCRCSSSLGDRRPWVDAAAETLPRGIRMVSGLDVLRMSVVASEGRWGREAASVQR